MERRDLIKILTAAAALPATAAPARFFNDSQYALLAELCEVVLPADERSPGAKAARVNWYIDTVLRYSDPHTQEVWRRGLDAAQQSGRTPQEIVAQLAEHENEGFFPVLKRMTIEAYYLSDTGMRQELGYRGA